MKPVQGNEQNCQCKNCKFKTEVEHPSIKRFIDQGSKIDRLYLGQYLPMREKKLLNKLLKIRAEYDDVRNEILALSASNVDVKEQAGLKLTNEKPRHRDETERSSAVSGLADKGAPGLAVAGARARISECCSCCSCGSILDDYGKTSRPFSRRGQTHKRGSHSSSNLRDKIKFKRRRRFKAKNISSAPCTCQAKISCIKEELNKEMALHSAKSRAEFKLEEDKREKIRKKQMKRMQKYHRKERSTSRIKITKQIKGRHEMNTDVEFDSALKTATESPAGKLKIKMSEGEKQKHTVTTPLPKHERGFRSKELEKSRNKITTEQPKYRQKEDSEESESFYTSTEYKKERKVKLDRFKKRRAKQESMGKNLEYSKFAQKEGEKVDYKRISTDKTQLKDRLKETKSTESASIPTEEEQKPPSKVIDISKKLTLNAHRYSKTRLRRSVGKSYIKLKAKRSRMKTNIEDSARKSLEHAKKIRNKINEKFGLEKSLQVMKRPKAALRNGDINLLVIKDISRSQSGIRRWESDEESDDEFLKTEHRTKHKEHRNRSTKMYKQNKRKDKNLGLDTKRKNRKIRDVSSSSSFTKSTISTPSLITKTSDKVKKIMSKHRKVDREMGCICIEDEFQKIERRAKYKGLRNQSTKIYKQTKRKDKNLGLDTKRKNRKIRDVSSSSSFTKSTISTPSLITKTSGKAKMTMSKHRKDNKEIKCRCIDDEFQKIDHRAKNKDLRNQSTKIYKQTKRKDKDVGELTKQRPEDSNLQKIAARTYVNIQAHEKEPIVSSDNKLPGTKPKHTNKRIRKISIRISGNKKRVEKHKVYVHKTEHESKSLKSAKSVSSATSKQAIPVASTGTVSKKMQVESIPEKSTLRSKGSNLRAQPEFKPKKRDRSLEKKGHRLQRKHSQRSTSTVKSKKYRLRRCMCTLKLGKQNKIKATKVKPKKVSKGSMTTQENIGDTLRQGLSSKSISLDNAEKSGNRRKRLLSYECEPGICVPDKCDPHDCLKLINSRERIVMKHHGKKSNTENPSIKSLSIFKSKSTTPSKLKRAQSKVAKYETGVPARKYNENVAVPPRKVLPSSNIPNRQAVKISSSFRFNIEFYKDRSPSPRSEKPSTKRVSRLGSFKSSDFIKPKLRGSQVNIKRNKKSSVTQVGVKQKNMLTGTTIKRCFCTLKKAAKKKKRISDTNTQKSSVSSRNVPERKNENSAKSQNAKNNEIIAYQLKQSIEKRHSRQTLGISKIFSFEQFYKYCLPIIETKLCAEGPINDRLDLMSNKNNKTKEIVTRNQESLPKTSSKSTGIIKIIKDCFCNLQLPKRSENMKLTNGKVAMSLAGTTITAKRHSLNYERKPRTLEIAYFKCENKTKVGNNFNLDPCYNKSVTSGIKSDCVNEHSKFNCEVSEKYVSKHQTKNKSGYFNEVNKKLPDTKKSNSFKLSDIQPLFKSSFYTMNVHVPDKIKRHKLKPYECEPGICIPGKCYPYECLKRINKRLMTRTSTMTTTAIKTTTGLTVRKPRRAHQVQSQTHVPTAYSRPAKSRPLRNQSDVVYEPAPSAYQRQVARTESTFNFDIEFLKNMDSAPQSSTYYKEHRTKPVNSVSPLSVRSVKSTKSRTRKNVVKQHRPKYRKQPVKSVSPSMSVGTVKSTTRRNKGIKPNKADRQNRIAKAVTKVVDSGSSVSHRVKRCFCTLKLQKKAKPMAKEPVSTTVQSTMAGGKSQKRKDQKRIKRNSTKSSSRSTPIVSNVGEPRRKHFRSRKRERGHENGLRSSRTKSGHSTVPHSATKSDHSRIGHERPRYGKTKAAPPAIEYQSTMTGRQVCKIGSSVSFSIEFHKRSIPTAHNVQAAAKKLKSQYSRTSRTTNVKRTKLKQKYTKPIWQRDSNVSTVSTSPIKVGHTRRSQAKIAQAHNRAITPMLKRCFCTLKLQKQGKYPPNHKEMKLVAHANKVAAHTTKTDYIKHEATLNDRGTQRNLKLYECEPGICVPGQCDPYQCQNWINQRLKREFGTSPAHRLAYKSVASTVGTRKKGRKIQHGSKRHKSTASVTTTNSRRRKMQHGGPRRSNVSSISSVSRPFKARRIHTGPYRSRKLQHTSKEPRQTTPSYIVSDTLSRQAVKISSSFKFNIEFYKDRGGEATELRKERPPPSPPRPAPQPLSTVTRATTSRATLHAGIGTHSKKTRIGESQFKKPKQAHAKTGNQLLKRCFCTLALKRKKLPARSSEVSTATRKRRHVEPTLSEASTVTKRASTRVKPTLLEISTVTKKEPIRPTDRHIATKTRRLEPYECEPYVCIPGKCNPRECLKRIQRRNMRNLSTTTAHDNTRSIGSTKTNASRPIKIQYKGWAKDAHSKMPRPHVRDAHAKSPTLYVKDSHSTSPKRYVRDAHSASSRRKVRHAHSTVTQRNTVSRTLRGPSPQPQGQATKIGSNFSFDIEFYKNKTLKAGKEPEYHEEKRHKRVNRTASMSPRHKKIQRHKKHRTSPSHIDRKKSIQSTMTESPPLKRCFCTLGLGLLDKNQVKQSVAITKHPQNVYVLLQPKGYTPNIPYKSNARKLDPDECESGICIPGECDPYKCLRRIQGRHVNSKKIGTDRYSRSSSSITPSSTITMQTQSRNPRCRYQKTQYDQYIVEKPRFNPFSRPISPTKKAIRVGSSFSFNIEFYKDTPGPNVPEAFVICPRERVRKSEDTRHEMRYTKPVPRSVKNRGVHSERLSYSDRHSQPRGASMEERGVGPLSKRCFCTLGLLQKTKKQQVLNQKSKPPVVGKGTATVAVGTNKQFSKLQTYECEPGICVPGECDPYECLKRMKRRHTRDFGTRYYHPFNRQASTYTSPDAISRGISPSSRNKYRNQSTTCPREKMKRAKLVSQNIAEPSLPTSGFANRQAVRIGSGFSFDIGFFKDGKSLAYPDKTAYKTYEPNYNFIHETKQKRPSVTRGYGDNVHHRNYASQMKGSKRESIGSEMGPLLKRCFCTLKLQKGLYGRTETVNYMCLPPITHTNTKITQNSCIKDITPINRIDRNCTKINKVEFKAEKQVIEVCSLPTPCRKNLPSRIINVIKNVFIALKRKYESKPAQRKSDNEKDKKKSIKDSYLVMTHDITGSNNKSNTVSKLADKVQKSCIICNDKQCLSNIKRNAGCNEMKTIFPYVPTKYNNNVSKTLIIQNKKLKSVLRTSGKYCSHCDKAKRTIDNKCYKNSPFKAVTKSNKIIFHNSSNPESKASKIINLKQIKSKILQLFKTDINVETKANINLRKGKLHKGMNKQNDEILKTSKSDRHPTSSKFNFIPKKSNSLKITKVSEKKRRDKNCMMFVEQGNKKYSRYQSGDAEQNVIKTNKNDGTRRSVDPFKRQNPTYVNCQPSHNQGKNNLITTNPLYLNNKVVHIAFVSPKREFKKKCNRTANTDECIEDFCVAEDVDCPCANRKRMSRIQDQEILGLHRINQSTRNKKIMARIKEQEIQDLHRINHSTRKEKSKACCFRLKFWKKQHDYNIHKTDKKEIKDQVDLSPKNISEIQAGVCKSKKPCKCCRGKKKKKTESDDVNLPTVNEKCVQDCTMKETIKKKKQNGKYDRKPLFEMKLEANSMDILNKEHVSDIVGRLRPKPGYLKEVLKLHGKSCQCCICKTTRKQGVDVSNLTEKLPKLSKKIKRKLNLKPCVCGSIECARESSRRAHKKTLSLRPKPKPCVCGTKICADETFKMELKQKQLPKKVAQKRVRQKSKRSHKKRLAQKKKNERDLLTRQMKYKMEDALRRKRQIIADKYMQRQVKKYAHASDEVLLVESVLDVAKLGVTTINTVMRCICRAIFNPVNAYRKMKTATQDPTRVSINFKDAVSELGVKATAQRVGYRIRALRMVHVFLRRLERKPVFNFLVHMFDNDPKKRMTHKKQRRRREPVDFGCNLFMATLRRRPHLWLYYFCPWFYPHCIGMINILKQFADAMLFILAVFVWSPCILAMEICRALMCCTLCTG